MLEEALEEANIRYSRLAETIRYDTNKKLSNRELKKLMKESFVASDIILQEDIKTLTRKYGLVNAERSALRLDKDRLEQ